MTEYLAHEISLSHTLKLLQRKGRGWSSEVAGDLQRYLPDVAPKDISMSIINEINRTEEENTNG